MNKDEIDKFTDECFNDIFKPYFTNNPKKGITVKQFT